MFVSFKSFLSLPYQCIFFSRIFCYLYSDLYTYGLFTLPVPCKLILFPVHKFLIASFYVPLTQYVSYTYLRFPYTYIYFSLSLVALHSLNTHICASFTVSSLSLYIFLCRTPSAASYSLCMRLDSPHLQFRSLWLNVFQQHDKPFFHVLSFFSFSAFLLPSCLSPVTKHRFPLPLSSSQHRASHPATKTITGI